MAKRLSTGSEWIWLDTADPGVSETGVFVGNLWLNTDSDQLFICSDSTMDSEVWQAYPTVPVIVAQGGTGNTSISAYSVVCGGTTSTDPLQVVSGLGTTGQVLTSNDTSALPTWQTLPAAGGLSIAAFGSTPNSNGLTLTSSALNMQPADGTNAGGVSTAAQIFAGAKTFDSIAVGGSGGPTITSGSGAPGTTQPKGSLYLRTDGGGVNDRAYIATDGAGTWTAIVTVG